MNDNLIELSGQTHLDIDPERILDHASGELDEVVVVGWCKNGDLYTASSTGDIAKMLLLCKSLEKNILDNFFEEL